MNKKLLLWLLVLSLCLTACYEIVDPSAGDDGGIVDTFRIGVVLPSSVIDLAFSQSMYEALNALPAEIGRQTVEIDIAEGIFLVTDAEDLLEAYAQDGYDLVIAHGTQFGVSIQQVAVDFPQTSFAWGNSSNTFAANGLENVFAYEARAEEGGYVFGVIAANLSQTGHVGYVGPVKIGDGSLYGQGFAAGVQAENQEIVVDIEYIDSYSDISGAAEAAKYLTTNGVDVLTASSQMFIGPIKVAQEDGALWFGNQYSQTDLAPDIVVASQVYNWGVILEEIIDAVQDGTLGGKSYALTFANEGLTIDYNPDFPLPPEVKARADSALRGIVNGTILLNIGE